MRHPVFSTNRIRRQFQSTHPLRGATRLRHVRPEHSIYFNPRTPCGVRPTAAQDVTPSSGFQSTHPLRGATGKTRLYVDVDTISIHAPLAGCDAQVPHVQQGKPISIHAPLAGCDLCDKTHNLYEKKFQSTHPLRGATNVSCKHNTITGISIHAPLAGCDTWLWIL